ncbi:copper oxidase [Enterococcus silesiacus]|uniref:Copper oxidase n=1 Tax=Enterococcus silesiacus TaxID=332949 RepID=A0A0S3KEB0_9ENTE|nr:multicopper oxidase domain-containing protein [Enterococcus silesiacus]ALS02632.1 copper oxidase [Enterococcus silesiacus]OJG93440.1 multicopper oxidase [Enterococcus silesiacus]
MNNNRYTDYFFDDPVFDRAGIDYIPLEKVKSPQNKLAIPPLLIPDFDSELQTRYTIVSQEGETQILPGEKTKTWGYNASLLGTTIILERGKNYSVTLKNELPELTTYHWHGLNVSGPETDGGPHAPVYPKGTQEIEFTVDQPASTAWLHPHPCPNTAEQVWKGLAAMVIIKDDQESKLPFPREYGVDDIPIVLQDRSYHDNQLDYHKDYNVDGTLGNIPLINGTVNAYFDVTTQQVRLRLLNGANRREFRLHFSKELPFTQIASDGGILPEPILFTHLMLTAGERAEIIADFKGRSAGEEIILYSDDSPLVAFKVGDFKENDWYMPEKLIEIQRLQATDSTVIEETVMSGMRDFVKIDDQIFDMKRIDKQQTMGETQIWDVSNINPADKGMIHPFHIHGTQFQVLSRNGRPPYPNELGWKDTIGVNAQETVRIAVRFDVPGVFMYHCHILEHEDTGMMAQIEVIDVKEKR